MTWNKNLPQGNEAFNVRWDIVPFTRGNVLDLGCGGMSPFPHFTGVDLPRAQVPASGRAIDVHLDCSKPMPQFGTESWDSVFSSHLLEHIEDYAAALREWWRIVRVGGYLVLYLPHGNLYPNIGTEGANPDHKHDFVRFSIVSVMNEIGGYDLIENQLRDKGDEYSFLQVFRKRGDKRIFDFTQNRPTKTAGVFRAGAFGDMIQASSVIKALHDEGYAVTLHTQPLGFDVVRHDPHIARIFIQEPDQIPAHLLHEYWAHLSKQYTKWVNLSGSVEEGLLAMPGHVNHRWPHRVRYSMMNRNYMEIQHDIAEVNAPITPLFYASVEEKAVARMNREKIHGRLVVWSLRGSAVHKLWPHYPELIEQIIREYDDVTIALAGDERAADLANVFSHPRILNKCGVWSIREAMAICEEADLIIGPETGLLNAAGHMIVPKIVLLSHSSPENLTKHWLNTIAIEPVGTPCYPCHILHKGFEFCHEVKPSEAVIQWANEKGIIPTGTALCMENISAERVFEAVKQVLGAQSTRRTTMKNIVETAIPEEGFERIEDTTGAEAKANARRRAGVIENNSQESIYQYSNNAGRTQIDNPAFPHSDD